MATGQGKIARHLILSSCRLVCMYLLFVEYGKDYQVGMRNGAYTFALKLHHVNAFDPSHDTLRQTYKIVLGSANQQHHTQGLSTCNARGNV